MPQLEWNEIDFLDFFNIEPTAEDFKVSHSYEIERNGLRLLFTIWQLESVIQVSVFRSDFVIHCLRSLPTSALVLDS